MHACIWWTRLEPSNKWGAVDVIWTELSIPLHACDTCITPTVDWHSTDIVCEHSIRIQLEINVQCSLWLHFQMLCKHNVVKNTRYLYIYVYVYIVLCREFRHDHSSGIAWLCTLETVWWHSICTQFWSKLNLASELPATSHRRDYFSSRFWPKLARQNILRPSCPHIVLPTIYIYTLFRIHAVHSDMAYTHTA